MNKSLKLMYEAFDGDILDLIKNLANVSHSQLCECFERSVGKVGFLFHRAPTTISYIIYHICNHDERD